MFMHNCRCIARLQSWRSWIIPTLSNLSKLSTIQRRCHLSWDSLWDCLNKCSRECLAIVEPIAGQPVHGVWAAGERGGAWDPSREAAHRGGGLVSNCHHYLPWYKNLSSSSLSVLSSSSIMKRRPDIVLKMMMCRKKIQFCFFAFSSLLNHLFVALSLSADFGPMKEILHICSF